MIEFIGKSKPDARMVGRIALETGAIIRHAPAAPRAERSIKVPDWKERARALGYRVS